LALSQLQKHGIEMPVGVTDSKKPSLKKRKTVMGDTLPVSQPSTDPLPESKPALTSNSSSSSQPGVDSNESNMKPIVSDSDKKSEGVVENGKHLKDENREDGDEDHNHDNNNKNGKDSNELDELDVEELNDEDGTSDKKKNNEENKKLLKPSSNEEKRNKMLERAKSTGVNLSMENEVTKHQKDSHRKMPSLNRQGSLMANLDDLSALMDGLDLGKEEVDTFVSELKELQDGMSKNENESKELREELQRKDSEMNQMTEELTQTRQEYSQVQDQIRSLL